MTNDQRAAWREIARKHGRPRHDREIGAMEYYEEDVLEAIDEAVAQERERCIKIAGPYCMTAGEERKLTAAIRALGKEK